MEPWFSCAPHDAIGMATVVGRLRRRLDWLRLAIPVRRDNGSSVLHGIERIMRSQTRIHSRVLGARRTIASDRQGARPALADRLRLVLDRLTKAVEEERLHWAVKNLERLLQIDLPQDAKVRAGLLQAECHLRCRRLPIAQEIIDTLAHEKMDSTSSFAREILAAQLLTYSGSPELRNRIERARRDLLADHERGDPLFTLFRGWARVAHAN